MYAPDNRSSTEGEDDKRSVKRVRFDLPPLPRTRTERMERSSAITLEPYCLTDADLAQSPHPEHHFGETNFDHEEGQDEEHCVACISPTPPSMMAPNEAMLLPEIRMEADLTPSLDDPCTSSPTTTTEPQEVEPHHQQRKRRKMLGVARETTRLKDIIGHGAVKLRIDELILPLGLPAAVSDSVLTGIRSIPASILLHGPPGCGKVSVLYVCATLLAFSLPSSLSSSHSPMNRLVQTKLAQAIAGEARAAFFSVAPSDVLSKFVGESEASIRNIFRKAVDHALQLESKCSVVFFDEIDALGQSRGNLGAGEGEGCSRRVLAELLLQLNVIADRKYCTLRDFGGDDDEVDTDNDEDSLGTFQQPEETAAVEHRARIIVVAASNQIYDIDKALLRRFGIQLEVGLPSWKDRKKMLTRHLNDIAHVISGTEIGNLAAVTEQWSGSAIESLAREAAMCPIRECIRRAAVIRKRMAKREQCGGDVSGQDDAPESPDPDTAADNCLLEGFQKLRPVSIDDFRRAIATLTGEQLPVTTTLGRKSERQAQSSVEHYDSSSSSGEEY
jgi:SpoVK/Ycf46/Vps4 family AAA+-type ATPase